MKVKKLPLAEFKYIYSKVPRLCVDLLIKNPNGVLLTKRAIEPKKGWWHLPGGTVLMGEKIEKTIVRVALEELNIKVKIIGFRGFIEYLNAESFEHPISAVFEVTPITNSPARTEQTAEIGYFTTPPKTTFPEVKKYLNTIL